jgi:hypothetical protein
MPLFKHSFSDQRKAFLKRQDYVEWITDWQNFPNLVPASDSVFERSMSSSLPEDGYRSREENVSEQQSRASLLIQSEAKML